MTHRTRDQQMLDMAVQHVQAVAARPRETRDIYGGLCHNFPVMIRTCGLCQALAFTEAKTASSDRNRAEAHEFIRDHAFDVLRKWTPLTGSSQSLLDMVRGMSMYDYALATRLLLDSWIYYKRFAESILGVTDAQAGKAE